ncbi:MAG: class 1 fructose-bisphosphatase [Sediminibacterium sp.]|nr:class 1 fructose-bisphosphatase [Sediminibacterium sp.]
MRQHIQTLEEFRSNDVKNIPQATGELSSLLRDMALAVKRINVEVNKAGLLDILGTSGLTNIQQEEVMKLDQVANDHILNVLGNGLSCAGAASEELDTIEIFNNKANNESKYIILYDPIDGSSNIDANVSIGTIFTIFKRKSNIGEPCNLNDFLQEGKNIIAAGYVVYGSSTIMVFATRRGVNGFTLDPTIGEFCLSHPNIQCPLKGNIISVNQANYPDFEESTKNFFRSLNKEGDRSYTYRYIGSLVADLHRNLLKGGLFLYPNSFKQPHGKLRLLYEAAPMAFIFEQAGGRATTGSENILDISPTHLHQRVPLIIGSSQLIEKFLEGRK